VWAAWLAGKTNRHNWNKNPYTGLYAMRRYITTGRGRGVAGREKHLCRSPTRDPERGSEADSSAEFFPASHASPPADDCQYTTTSLHTLS